MPHVGQQPTQIPVDQSQLLQITRIVALRMRREDLGLPRILDDSRGLPIGGQRACQIVRVVQRIAQRIAAARLEHDAIHDVRRLERDRCRASQLLAQERRHLWHAVLPAESVCAGRLTAPPPQQRLQILRVTGQHPIAESTGVVGELHRLRRIEVHGRGNGRSQQHDVSQRQIDVVARRLLLAQLLQHLLGDCQVLLGGLRLPQVKACRRTEYLAQPCIAFRGLQGDVGRCARDCGQRLQIDAAPIGELAPHIDRAWHATHLIIEIKEHEVRHVADVVEACIGLRSQMLCAHVQQSRDDAARDQCDERNGGGREDPAIARDRPCQEVAPGPWTRANRAGGLVAIQIVDQLGDAGIAVFALQARGPRNNRAQIAVELPRRGSRATFACGQQLLKHHAQRPDIARRRGRRAPRALWTCIGPRERH